MGAEVDNGTVVRWCERLIMLCEWLWIRAALISMAFLVLVFGYDWAWGYVFWPLAGALVARILTYGVK